MTLAEELKAQARSLGFARCGIAAAGPLEGEGDRLRHWLAQGRHGSMAYMRDTADVRCDVRHDGMLPSAASVVVVAAPYARPAAPVFLSPGRVARYAIGRDYHNVLGKRLRKLATFLRERGHDARAGVDSMPIFERAWAERAGVGFIGKNCCLIVPGVGSHLFLGAVVTSAELAPDAPMSPRCGECRACLDACPTRAFEGPRELDARRCISYLTIEHRGAIATEHRDRIGDWLFGCDACQDVCPFNHGRFEPGEPAAPFATHPRFDTHDAASLLAMDDDAFARFAEGSPLKRAKREGLARNAAIVLGNSGERVHLPVLREAASNHDREVVREAAQWAIAKLER